MDDVWGESATCVACGAEAQARLTMELRMFGEVGAKVGFCAIHMAQVSTFIRAIKEFEHITSLETDVKGGKLSKEEVDHIATAIAERAGERVLGRIKQIKEIQDDDA